VKSAERQNGPAEGDRRAIRSLSERAGVPEANVRSLFERELARLELGATVRSYLSPLAAANVRRMFGCMRESLRTAAKRIHLSSRPSPRSPQLADWENEGGALVRTADGEPVSPAVGADRSTDDAPAPLRERDIV
jgi:hypothetical protein